MPSDAWAGLNRRAAAVQGGVPWENGAEAQSVLADGTVEKIVGTVVGSIGGLPVVWWPDLRETRAHQPIEHLLPRLQHAGTRGILRAALGSPNVEYSVGHSRRGAVQYCRVYHDGMMGENPGEMGEGATREQAEAAALVALAEARNEWGPG